MRFEKAYERSKQGRLGRAPSKLVGPDSGQVDEALRPTLRPKRCGKRGERERDRIIWYPGRHSLEQPQSG